MVLILRSVTKGIRFAGIASKASASAWATILCFGLRRQPRRPSSQPQILHRRSSSSLRVLRRRVLLHTPLRRQGICPLPHSLLRPPFNRNHPARLPTCTNTAPPSTPLWEIRHRSLRICRTLLIHGLLASRLPSEVRISFQIVPGGARLYDVQYQLTFLTSGKKYSSQ